MEKFRNQAIETINFLKYFDYDETPILKKYYSGKKPDDIRDIWRNIPQEVKLNEKKEIYDSPLKFSGVSYKQGFFNWNNTEIYFTESILLTDILNVLIEYSQTNQEYFGLGTNKLNSLLIQKFQFLFPREIRIDGVYNNELEYYNHIITCLKREYVLFITKDNNCNYFKLIIPLFRAEKDGEYIGGLLHLLQHLQINGSPISAQNKTQKGDTEFYSDLLFKNIIEAFFFVVEKDRNLTTSKSVNFDFHNAENVRIKGGFFYNFKADVWFINSIMQR